MASSSGEKDPRLPTAKDTRERSRIARIPYWIRMVQPAPTYTHRKTAALTAVATVCALPLSPGKLAMAASVNPTMYIETETA